MKYFIPLPTMIFFMLLFIGCSQSSSDNGGVTQNTSGISNEVQSASSISSEVQSASGADSWYRPSPLITWHIQLNGEINTSHQVQLYDIDLFDSSVALIQQLQATGIKVICYFSAGSYEEWRPDAKSFMPGDLGNPLDGWAGESWLNIRSDNVRSIMKDRLDLAKSKGCDGVDPDNMDGYTNKPGFNLTASDQLDYNRFIANEAHSRNLAVGLKNDVDQIEELVEYFDFAVNEQCFEYNECSDITPFIANNKPVLNIEYKRKYVKYALMRDVLCNDSINKQFSSLVLPLELDDQFRLSCF